MSPFSFCIREFFYSTIDEEYYHDNEFIKCLEILGLGHLETLSRSVTLTYGPIPTILIPFFLLYIKKTTLQLTERHLVKV